MFTAITLELEALEWSENQFEKNGGPQDVSFYQTEVLGKVFPQSRSQIVQALKVAKALGVSIYPISCGNNWAFGGQIPFSRNCLIVDMSGVKNVEVENRRFGVVRIEPGVTQGALFDFLEKHMADYFIDVTGSGTQTSVLGNCLERGIAYNGLRAKSVVSMEVLLSSGEIIHTGFGGRDNCDVSSLYEYGLGPDLRGLFFQSNLGVVLSICLQLMPKQERLVSFSVSVGEADLGEFIEILSSLLSEQTLDCICHIADPVRLRSTLEPIFDSNGDLLKELNSHLNSRSAGAMPPKVWTCGGSISGPGAIVASKKRRLKSILGKKFPICFYSEKKLQLAERLLNWGPFRKKAQFLKATRSLRGLHLGRPTDDPIKMLNWIPHPIKTGDVSGEAKERNIGTIFSVPLTTMDSAGVVKVLGAVESFSRESELVCGITLNTLSRSVLEAVVSVHFDRRERVPAEVHKLFDNLNQDLMRRGAVPYRLNPGLMASSWELLPHKELTQQLKKELDPADLLSPGHYVRSSKAAELL